LPLAAPTRPGGAQLTLAQARSLLPVLAIVLLPLPPLPRTAPALFRLVEALVWAQWAAQLSTAVRGSHCRCRRSPRPVQRLKYSRRQMRCGRAWAPAVPPAWAKSPASERVGSGQSSCIQDSVQTRPQRGRYWRLAAHQGSWSQRLLENGRKFSVAACRSCSATASPAGAQDAWPPCSQHSQCGENLTGRGHGRGLSRGPMRISWCRCHIQGALRRGLPLCYGRRGEIHQGRCQYERMDAQSSTALIQASEAKAGMMWKELSRMINQWEKKRQKS
jgi:hypothetical protein